MLGASAELHVEGDLRAHDLPGVAEAQPLVGELDLPAVANRLIEDAELVADAVADRGNVERRQRVHVTGGQAAEPAIAEARLFFLVQEVGEILPDSGHRLLRRLPDPEVDQAVAQMRPGQKFGREIGHDLGRGIRCGNRFHRLDIAVQHAVANRIGEGHVPVVARCVLRQLGLQIVQVVDQRLTDGLDIESRADVRSLAPLCRGLRGTTGGGFHRIFSLFFEVAASSRMALPVP